MPREPNGCQDRAIDAHLVLAHSNTKSFITQFIAVILTLEENLSDVMKPAFKPNPIELDPGLLSQSNVLCSSGKRA